MRLTLFICFGFVGLWLSAVINAAVIDVTVTEEGHMIPMWIEVHDGDTVRWTFPAGQSGSIAPVDWAAVPGQCTSFKPYDPNDPNEFTKPMMRAPAGVFSLGPKVAPYAPHQDVIDSPDIAGVFLRFKWNELETAPDVFDWTYLDAEIDRIVDAGKLYSIAIKAGEEGTPTWLFTDLGLPELLLGDKGSNPSGSVCASTSHSFGNPTRAKYRQRYNLMLEKVANHIKEKNAWYQALAYIKPSGANLKSHENRLPKRCDPSCAICNTKILADDGYTPDGLYKFYRKQMERITDHYPNKDMSYMLIQAGFPLITDATDYQGCSQYDPSCDESNIPGGVEQTQTILDNGALVHEQRFIVQHNGLGPDPSPYVDCAVDPRGSGCPNPYVISSGGAGQITGFQTQNTNSVNTLPLLDKTFQNALNNSDAIFVEAYEGLLLAAINVGGVLDAAVAIPRTLADWNQEFINRRNGGLPAAAGLDNINPSVIEHTFTYPANAVGTQIIHYIDPGRCDRSGANATYGGIKLLP